MNVALTRLALVNFRSHRRAEIKADTRPVVLYGANGAGKTNILEAISMLSPGRGLRRVPAADMTRRPGAAGWKVSALIEGGGDAHEIDTWAEGTGGRQVRIDGKAATQGALGHLLRVLWLIPSMDRLWIESADGRRRFLDRMTLSLNPAHGVAVLSYEKAMRERNRLLKDQVRNGSWYDALEARMAGAGAAIRAARRETLEHVADAQQGGETAFPAADLMLEASGPDQTDALREALAEGRGRDMAAGRTLTGPHRDDLAGTYAAKGLPARDCSTGEQKALLVSLILANARALRTLHGTPPVLLLDEVAAHLDAGRRAALYDEIAGLGAQAWLTGTGPELFEMLGSRALWLEVCEGSGIAPVSPRE